MKKQKLEDENHDSDSEQEALLIKERDSSAPSRSDNGALDKQESVPEGLSNDECGLRGDMILTSAALS